MNYLIVELKHQKDLENAYAERRIHFALKRLKTPLGRRLADEILVTHSAGWWFDGNDHWWA
jgi:putative hydrolase of HD superfamily